MALVPWNVIVAGKLRTDAEEKRRRRMGEKGRTPLESEMSLALERK